MKRTLCYDGHERRDVRLICDTILGYQGQIVSIILQNWHNGVYPQSYFMIWIIVDEERVPLLKAELKKLHDEGKYKTGDVGDQWPNR